MDTQKMIFYFILIITICPQFSNGCWNDDDVRLVYDQRCISVMECARRNMVIYKNTCIHVCPSDAPYLETETWKCQTECPYDTVLNGTVCLQPTYCTSENKVVSNHSCATFCPANEPYENFGVCYPMCPSDTVSNASKCISFSECRKTSYLYNGTCRKECPKEASFSIPHNKACVTTCPLNTVYHGRQCIAQSACIQGNNNVVFNRTCKENCPLQSPFNAFGLCKPSCPVDTYVDGMVCQRHSHCINKGMFVFNATCLPTCPIAAPRKAHGQCVADCPKDTFIYEQNCITVAECIAFNKVTHNGSCVPFCPAISPYLYQGRCLSTCPNNTLVDIGSCITSYSCVIKRFKIYKGHCLQICPADAPYTYKKDRYGFYGMIVVCRERCPNNTLLFKNSECIAVTDCWSKGNIYKDLCLLSCPQNTSMYKNGYRKYCTDRCPGDTVSVGNQCKSKVKCTSLENVLFNQMCVRKCPPKASLLYKSECFADCPQNTFLNNGSCMENNGCTAVNRVIYNRSCVDSCPKEQQYNASGICSVKCPSGTYAEDFHCHNISECRHRGMFMFKGICVRNCIYEAYYQYEGNCVSVCPKGTYLDGIQCLDVTKCQKNGMFISAGKCISRCPYEAQYQYKGHCVNDCPEDSLKLGLFCKFPKDKCGPYTDLFDGKECVYDFSCVADHKIKHEGGCIVYCPYGLFSYNNACVNMPDAKLSILIICTLVVFCLATVMLITCNPRKSRFQGRQNCRYTLKRMETTYENPCFGAAELTDVCTLRQNEEHYQEDGDNESTGVIRHETPNVAAENSTKIVAYADVSCSLA